MNFCSLFVKYLNTSPQILLSFIVKYRQTIFSPTTGDLKCFLVDSIEKQGSHVVLHASLYFSHFILMLQYSLCTCVHFCTLVVYVQFYWIMCGLIHVLAQITHTQGGLGTSWVIHGGSQYSTILNHTMSFLNTIKLLNIGL